MKIWYLFPAVLALTGCPKNSSVDNPIVPPETPENPDNPNNPDNPDNPDNTTGGALDPLTAGVEQAPYSYQDWENTTLDAAKPNIILVICDQMFVNKIHAMGKSGAMGGSYNKTPNLDYLVKNGYYFCNTYCSFPLSVPSRFSLFSGCNAAEYSMNGNTVGSDVHIAQVQLAISQGPLLGTLLQTAGYNTVYGGKTHLPGVDGNAKQTVLYGFDTYYSSDTRHQLGLDAAKNIGAYSRKNKPFFLVASFINPHDIDFYDDLIGYPITDEDSEGAAADVIQKYWGTAQAYLPPSQQWKTEFPPIVPNLALTDPVPIDPTLAYHNNMPGRHPAWPRPDTTIVTKWRQRAWLYDRLCEELDKDLTPIMDTVRKLRLLNNSILIFTADHGELNGAHELERKQAPYDECQKVPFIFVGQGMKQHKDDVNWVVNGFDLMPTLCDIAGVTAPQRNAGGLSLKSLLTGVSPTLPQSRDYFFIDGPPNWHQIVYQKRYKYTLIFSNKAWWETLIDLNSDPLELKNLKGDAAYAGMKATLRGLLWSDMQRRTQIANLGNSTIK